MGKVFSGKYSAAGKNYGIVISRFNDFLSKSLLEGAMDCLERHGAGTDKIDIAWVPGALEIPQAAQSLIQVGRYDAVICLGVIVRGDTPHADIIASAVTKQLSALALEGTPVINGVLTAENLEQAIERAGTKAGNRGWQAALAAIEMADLATQIKGRRK